MFRKQSLQRRVKNSLKKSANLQRKLLKPFPNNVITLGRHQLLRISLRCVQHPLFFGGGFFSSSSLFTCYILYRLKFLPLCIHIFVGVWSKIRPVGCFHSLSSSWFIFYFLFPPIIICMYLVPVCHKFFLVTCIRADNE